MHVVALFACLLTLQDPTDPAQYVLPWASSSTEIKDVAFSPDGKSFALISPACASVWDAEASLPGPFTPCFPAGIAWNSERKRFGVNVFHSVYPSGSKKPQSLRFNDQEPEDLGIGGDLQFNGPSASPYRLEYTGDTRVHAYANVPGHPYKSIDRSLSSLNANLVLCAPNRAFWVQNSTSGEVTVTEAKDERVKPKWNPKKSSLGPYTIQPAKSLLASRDLVINFKDGKPFTEPGVGLLNAFSFDGSTLVSIDELGKAVNFRDMKTSQVAQVTVVEPKNYGRLLPSPDGSYAILTDLADEKRNIFAQPGGRRAWQVFRSGQVIRLEDNFALRAYIDNVKKYLGDKTRIDAILTAQDNATNTPLPSSSPTNQPRPSHYPTKTDLSVMELFLQKKRQEGFKIIEDRSLEGKGRSATTYSYGPFTWDPGNEYLFVGYIDAAKARELTYVNFFRYERDERGKIVHVEDYLCDMKLVGSAIYKAQTIAIAEVPPGKILDPTEAVIRMMVGGFDPVRVLVMKRRLPK